MLTILSWHHPKGYRLSCDPAEADPQALWNLVRHHYWTQELTYEQFAQALDHSVPFTLMDDHNEIVGFARLVTDKTRFGWLSDLVIAEPLQGQGLGQWVVRTLLSHPQVVAMARIMLATDDAQDFYARFGFEAYGQDSPRTVMERCQTKT